jgi:hypothetical protein
MGQLPADGKWRRADHVQRRIQQGGAIPSNDLIQRLEQFARCSNHEFWPDDVSLRDNAVFVGTRLHSSRLITDIYLLALATKHEGRLATFDEGIPVSAVCAATTSNLCMV